MIQKIYIKVILLFVFTIGSLLSNTVVAQTTVDLTVLDTEVTNLPAGTSVSWHTATPATDANRITMGNTPSDPTVVVPGVNYYMSFYDATNMCYSSTVAIPTYINTCPATTVDLTTNAPTNMPVGTSLTWHTSSPATTANLVLDATIVSAGIYYAAFYDAVNDCYSDTTTPGLAVIGSCVQALITQIYHTDSPNVAKIIEVTNVDASETIPANYIRLSLFSNTSGDQTGIMPTAVYTVAGALAPGQSALIETGNLSGVNIVNTPVEEVTTSVTNFDGANDIIILSTTTDASSWANRLDVFEGFADNTSYVRNDDIITGSITATASEWTAFVDDALDPYVDAGSGGPERHPHDPLLSEVQTSVADKNQGLGYHTTGTTIRTGAVWTNGLPDRSRRVFVSEDYAHTGSSLAVKELTLNTNSKLSISDNLLVVTDQIMLTNTNDEIRLVGTSQLVLTHTNGTQVSGNGKLYIDQNSEVPSTYRYNYFSSPVNTIGATTYTVADVFKDGTIPVSTLSVATDINFISGYDGIVTTPISIAEYWVYAHGASNNWVQRLSAGTIPQTDGIIFKGPGQAQNYTFVGTPKDGNMQTTVAADASYLVGNPYASAISVKRFIEDNITTTTGTLYFWEQKESVNGDGAQDAHNYDGYVGGYATRNIAMGLAANNPLNDANGSLGIAGVGSGVYKEPKEYVAVGQGFFVEGSGVGGNIVFNNSQREFIAEGAQSIFFRSGDAASDLIENENVSSPNSLPIIKLGMDYVNTDGLSLHRQIGVSFLQSNSFAFETGYDAPAYETGVTDFYWSFQGDNEKYAIAGVQEITDDLEVPLTINIDYTGEIKILIDEWANINRDVYLIDKVENRDYLISGASADMFLNAGMHVDRFVLAFRTNGTLSTTAVNSSQFYIYTENATQDILIVNSNRVEIENVKLYDILGKEIQTWDIIKQESSNNKLQLKTNNISSGVYFLKLKSTKGVSIKKVYLGFN